jgi:hypothetical protein
VVWIRGAADTIGVQLFVREVHSFDSDISLV